MEKVKKNFFRVALFCFVLTGCIYNLYYKNSTSTNEIINPLLLQNMEALASTESLEKYMCYGNGSIDCPNGSKVSHYIQNLNIE